MNGFFKIQRRFFSHWLWKEDRSLSKAEAFLDLLQLAAFAPTKRVIRGTLIRLEQGELIASIRYLSARWVWGKDKVATFLKVLEADEMIERETRQSQTVITLCNYEHYAELKDANKDANKDSDRTVTGHPPGQRIRSKEGEEGKEEEGKVAKAPLPPSVVKSTKSKPATSAECEEYAVELRLPASDGASFFAAKEANGWMGGKVKVKDWKAAMRSWKLQAYHPSQKTDGRGGNTQQVARTTSRNQPVSMFTNPHK